MENNISEQVVIEFKHHYENGNQLTKGLFILDGIAPTRLGYWKTRKAKKAIEHFNICLSLVPNHWPTKWILGKIYQSLGKIELAFDMFNQAYEIEKTNLDVAREASISAMELGKIELGLMYSYEAVKLDSKNAGLLCNYALNLMISGKDKEANIWIDKAIEIDNSDKINQNVKNLITKVSEGKQKRPTFNEVFRK